MVIDECLTMSAIRIGICSLLAFAVLADGGVPDWSTAVLEIGTALLFVLWSFVNVRQRQMDVRSSWLYLPVLGLIAFCVAQKFFGLSAYPYATKIELLKWIAYFALVFLAVESFRSAAQLETLSIFLVSLGFVVALFAIAQHYTFNGKLYWFVPLPQSSEPFGPFVDRDHFAGFVELTAPLGLAMLFKRNVARRESSARGVIHRRASCGARLMRFARRHRWLRVRNLVPESHIAAPQHRDPATFCIRIADDSVRSICFLVRRQRNDAAIRNTDGQQHLA